MARPRAEFPTPGKRRRGRVWGIFWRGRGRFYAVSTGTDDETVAERLRIEVALALRGGVWPKALERAAAVVRYKADTAPVRGGGDVLAEYERGLRHEVSEAWAGASLATLRELAACAGDLERVGRKEAGAFLEHVLNTPGPFLKARGKRSKSTRNRILAICSRFYGWAERAGRVESNPFAGISRLAEADPVEIVHLTRGERDVVLNAFDADRDALGVWLALYGGLRRGEVARLRWADVSLERRKISIVKSKTGKRRVVDIAGPLLQRLTTVPKKRRRGRVVAWPAVEGLYKGAAKRCLERVRVLCPQVAASRIGWNSFRHTFASLLVQSGVSIFKVAAWMGNSIDVCRRHYAAMMPEHDPDIDRL